MKWIGQKRFGRKGVGRKLGTRLTHYVPGLYYSKPLNFFIRMKGSQTFKKNIIDESLIYAFIDCNILYINNNLHIIHVLLLHLHHEYV